MASNQVAFDKPQRPRRWFWRLFVCLVLGFSGWIGLGEWLSAPSLYTLKFVNPSPEDKESGWYVQAGPLDADGQFILIIVRHSWTYTLHIVDLASGHVRKTIYSPSGDQDFPDGVSLSVSSLVTQYPRLGPKNGLAYFTGFDKVNDERGWYEWDLFSNSKRLIHRISDPEKVTFNRKGTTLLDQSDLPLSPLTILTCAPPALGVHVGCMTAQACSLDAGLTWLRAFSLPDMRCRCRFVIPSMLKRGSISLDGRWFAVGDRILPEGWTSNVRVHQTSEEADRPPSYFGLPSGLRVYDLAGGTLWYAFSTDSEAITTTNEPWRCKWNMVLPLSFETVDLSPNGKKRRQETEKDKQDTNGQSFSWHTRFLHLPSRTWIAGEGLSYREAPAQEQGTVRWLSSDEPSAGAEENMTFIWESDARGETKPAGMLQAYAKGGPYLECLVPYSSLAVVRQNESRFPRWLSEKLVEWHFPKEWVDYNWKEVALYDYQKREVVWRMKGDHEHAAKVTPSGKHLIVTTSVDDGYTVSVLSFPLPNWSRWWARCAGLVVFIASFALLLRLRSRRHLMM